MRAAAAVSATCWWVNSGHASGRLTARPPAPPPRCRQRRPSRPGSASQTNVSWLPAGPGRPEDAKPSTAAPSDSRGPRRHVDQRLAPVVGRPHDAALPHPLAPDLELGLDHRQAVPALGRARERRGQSLAQRDERDVGDDEVGRVGQRAGLERARVHALDHRHARVVADLPVKLPVGHVERDHARGAALEQAVGEAAGGGADVERQLAPPGSRPSASSAFASFTPPRET